MVRLRRPDPSLIQHLLSGPEKQWVPGLFVSVQPLFVQLSVGWLLFPWKHCPGGQAGAAKAIGEASASTDMDVTNTTNRAIVYSLFTLFRQSTLLLQGSVSD